MNLNSILIGSEDPQRLSDYYTQLFDKPGWEGGDFKGWQLGSGWLTVGPHDQVNRPALPLPSERFPDRWPSPRLLNKPR